MGVRNICVYVQIPIMCLYVCVYTHTHIHTYIHICICIYVYTYIHTYMYMSNFPGGSELKNLPAMQEMQVQSLGQEDPLEMEMATHSSILAWEIP